MTETDVEKMAAFMDEAARYFSKRKTGGEDRAHWSNVYNAENCKKIAARLRSLSARVEDLEHDIERHLSIASEEATRAEAAEAKVAEIERLIEIMPEAVENPCKEWCWEYADWQNSIFKCLEPATPPQPVTAPRTTTESE